MRHSGFILWAAILGSTLPLRAEDTPLVVEVIPVEAVAVPRTYAATGEVVARDLRSVSFADGGRVTSVLVDAGDLVVEGQELARLDPVQQQQRLKAAEAAVIKADADSAKARDDAQRMTTLLAQGAATRAQRDDAQAQMAATSALADKARAERDSAQKQFADTVLRAPVNGMITARKVEEGLVIGAAEPAFDIAAGPALDASFDLAEVIMTRDLPKVPAVTLTLLEGDGAPVTGQVREVSPVVDAAHGTVLVKVAIDGTPPGFTIGAPVRGAVAVAEPALIRLPVWALGRSASGAVIWVRDPASGAVSQRSVVIGGFETDSVIIASGLTVGEQVIGRGAQLMYAGRLTVAAQQSVGQ